MRTALKIGAVVAALAFAPLGAQAGRAEGVGIGAGAGFLVAGPLGALVGGLAGYFVGGPDLLPPKYTCWRDDNGKRRCRQR